METLSLVLSPKQNAINLGLYLVLNRSVCRLTPKINIIITCTTIKTSDNGINVTRTKSRKALTLLLHEYDKYQDPKKLIKARAMPL